MFTLSSYCLCDVRRGSHCACANARPSLRLMLSRGASHDWLLLLHNLSRILCLSSRGCRLISQSFVSRGVAFRSGGLGGSSGILHPFYYDFPPQALRWPILVLATFYYIRGGWWIRWRYRTVFLASLIGRAITQFSVFYPRWRHRQVTPVLLAAGGPPLQNLAHLIDFGLGTAASEDKKLMILLIKVAKPNLNLESHLNI